ncbi:hypothetical protein HYC85_030443 [Camellia sinensis]|uniref:Calcineurin-like phosphoesterase domain-containing protein n=1 Tax=Camellia sinensis TaxID=4442 RepID=A0A7J7G0W6_CAMSI|nr:hypothetical protein HYC85_030443 [Camellia sinensis]
MRIYDMMGVTGEKLHVDFVISTGDNFYNNGITSSKDPGFVDSFAKVYTARRLQKPRYSGFWTRAIRAIWAIRANPSSKYKAWAGLGQQCSVLGNHDYRGNALALLNSIPFVEDTVRSCRITVENMVWLWQTGVENTVWLVSDRCGRHYKVMSNHCRRHFEQIMAAQSNIEANRYTLKSCVETMTAVTNLSHWLQNRTKLLQVQISFVAKYGKEFVSAATEPMPECGVGRIAKRQAVVNSENTFFSMKRFIGRKMSEVEPSRSPTLWFVMRMEMSSLSALSWASSLLSRKSQLRFWRKLADDASKCLNDKVTKAVVLSVLRCFSS